MEPNSTLIKKGRTEGLNRGNRQKVRMCICINLCDKQSASSLLTEKPKKKTKKQLSSVFPVTMRLYLYSEITEVLITDVPWLNSFLVSLLLREQKGKNPTSPQNFKLPLTVSALLLTVLYASFLV